MANADAREELQALRRLAELEARAAQDRPASEKAGAALREVPRQVGLTARYGLEGPARLLDMFAAPFRLATNAALGAAGLPQAKPIGDEVSALATRAGLPEPQTPDERVIGDATRAVAGGGAMTSAACGGA